MRLNVSVDQPSSDSSWNMKPRGHEWLSWLGTKFWEETPGRWPNTSLSRDFAQFLGLTINSWVFPHHSGSLCYPKVSPTISAHMENRPRGGLQGEFNRISISPKKTWKSPAETKSYLPKEQQNPTSTSPSSRDGTMGSLEVTSRLGSTWGTKAWW